MFWQVVLFSCLSRPILKRKNHKKNYEEVIELLHKIDRACIDEEFSVPLQKFVNKTIQHIIRKKPEVVALLRREVERENEHNIVANLIQSCSHCIDQKFLHLSCICFFYGDTEFSSLFEIYKQDIKRIAKKHNVIAH